MAVSRLAVSCVAVRCVQMLRSFGRRFGGSQRHPSVHWAAGNHRRRRVPLEGQQRDNYPYQDFAKHD